jgi:hypothetical protein
MRLTGTDALNGRLVEQVIENQTIVERRELSGDVDPADDVADKIHPGTLLPWCIGISGA